MQAHSALKPKFNLHYLPKTNTIWKLLAYYITMYTLLPQAMLRISLFIVKCFTLSYWDINNLLFLWLPGPLWGNYEGNWHFNLDKNRVKETRNNLFIRVEGRNAKNKRKTSKNRVFNLLKWNK